jgi:amino acid adenylation domain-containing protein/non-ribosomal peptide synthase protein (TIGR01720 family)
MSKTEISTRRSQLSPAKQALLTQRLRGKTDPTSETIPPRSHGENIPLSFAQQRLWFLHQLDPDNAFYNELVAVKLQGDLNIAALEQSLNQIVSRHEALRTNFPTSNGQPIQIIHPSLKVPLTVTNLQELLTLEQENAFAQIAIAETHQPFDLTQDPLLRLRLLQLSATENVLLFIAHHIIFDGWSLGILVKELAEFYKCFSRNLPLSLPELPIQYADFAIWQRQRSQQEEFDRQLAYWQQQLQDLPILELPTDKPRSLVQNFRGAKYFFNLSLELSESLKTLSQQEDTTLFMTLLAAFQVLLHRYASQDDIVVGTVIANRNRPEIEPAIGFFVNTLVLRTYLGDNPTFRQLLARVREVTLAAYSHQDLPFEKLVEALNPERTLSRSPLFQVMFALNNAPLPSLELDRLQMIPLDIDRGIAKFDLDLSLTETERGLSAAVEYDTDLFSHETIARMMSHWQTLLASIVANSELYLADLPLLSDTERQQFLGERERGSEGVRERGSENYFCVHQLFEQQVERTPNAIAVVFGEQQLTYQELDRQANYLAHYLQQLGVKSEVLVGICIERSLEMVIGILAILKAGGAYLPLDPTYPQERLAFMLADSQAPVLLTQSHLIPTLPKHNAQIVCLDSNWETEGDVGAQSIAPLQTQNPTNLAYVIYTSGSTGKPKGVLISHQALVARCWGVISAYQINPADRILQFASLSFDVAAEEIFPFWLMGATVVLPPEKQLLASQDFCQLLERQQITVLNLPSSYWQQWVSDLDRFAISLPSQLRLVIVGNEPVLPASLALWHQLVGDRIRWLNAYGPTETTITATIYEPEFPPNFTSAYVPIGRPLDNTEIYILDRNLNPVPVGVPGELYIGGGCLARGYLNQPELTAEKFIINPFDESKTRLYRTGDLARWLPDRNIEFRGRVDYQVKIRGFRIELGEVEVAIQQYPEVKEVVTLVREDTPGDKRLVAYIAPKLKLADVREFLTENLPVYMIPSSFVFLESLPRTPNGKIDRRALPTSDKPQLSSILALPHNAVEAALVEIWSEVLNLSLVGIYDNFFELGGDSILAIAVISQANRRGLHLTPKQLFQHQTIAELATAVDPSSKIVAEQGAVTGEVPLTPIQRWFFEQQFEQMHHWNQSLWLEVKPGTNWQLLEKAIASLLTHHDALRMQFVRQGNSWRQTCLKPDDFGDFIRFDLSHQSEEEQKLEIERLEAELQASLQLEYGKIFKAAFFDLGDRSRLLIIIHHLVVDGVSWRILLEDLQTAYEQINQERAIALPPKTTSFKQWAEKLTVYAQSAEVIQNPVTIPPLPSLGEGLGVRAGFSERDFWLQEQQGNNLPIDFPGGSNTVADSQTFTVKLSSTETQALLQDVPATYRTQINEVLLTALVQAFAEWTGEPSLLLDLEAHGREELFSDVDLSRTVGWFTTIFPVFLDLSGTPFTSPGKALQAVKEQLRRIPNRGFNYGVLRYLAPNPAIQSKSLGVDLKMSPPSLRGVRGGSTGGTDTKSGSHIPQTSPHPQPLSHLSLALPYEGREKEVSFSWERGAGSGSGKEGFGDRIWYDITPAPEVSFNYLGQFDRSFANSSLFELDEELNSCPFSPQGNRPYLLEIDSRIVSGEFQAIWTYSRTLHRQHTIENLAQSFIEKLRSLIAHCQSSDAGGYTPSDFPLAQLTQDELDTVLSQLTLNFLQKSKS